MDYGFMQRNIFTVY